MSENLNGLSDKELLERLRQALSQIDCRSLYEAHLRLGRLLIEWKRRTPWGQWAIRVKSLGLSGRTERLYRQMACQHAKWQGAAASNDPNPQKPLTLRKLISLKIDANHAIRDQERAETRLRLAKEAVGLPTDPNFAILTSDCRSYSWPEDIGLIATDPPWSEMKAYCFVAELAVNNLRHGGIVLVQTAIHRIGEVIPIMEGAGLTYRHCLAVMHAPLQRNSLTPPFTIHWRPILLFTKGKLQVSEVGYCRDALLAPSPDKWLHEWQQPVLPWTYWLHHLAPLGSLVADPFCGSGTIGVAAKTCGGLRFVGTEISPGHAAAAAARLKLAVEGSYRPAKE